MIDLKKIERNIKKWECGGSLLELIWKTEGIDQPTIVALMKKREWKQRKTEERLNTLRKLGWIRKDISFDHNRKANTAKCYSLITRDEYNNIYKNTYFSRNGST